VAKQQYISFTEPRKIVIIPNGVDTSLFRPAESVKSPKSDPTILTVCKLIERKGVEYLIYAVKRLVSRYPKLKLRIIGDGPKYTQLIRLVKELDIERNVEFMGKIPHYRLVEQYHDCDIFCLPSLSDPFPNVVLEAMACGKPVVATKVGGISEIITNGRDGVLVPPADVNSLRNALSKLIQDTEFRDEIGQQAVNTIRQRFSWDIVADSYIKVYRALLG
jgi:glycosyltransferase involved in cell wall biosynthesis